MGNDEIAKLKETISLLEQKNKVLEQTAERLRLALDCTELALWDWNIKTNAVVFNDTFGKILGYDAQEISPDYEAWSSRIHPDDQDAIIGALENHLAGETDVYETKHRLLNKEGSWEWILDRGKVVEWDERGAPLRATGTCRKITQEKESELETQYHKNNLEELVAKRTEELAISEQLAHAANRAKSEFLANMSHELRTPMHGILSYSSLGEAKVTKVSLDKIKSYFGNIRISGERLLNLLNDLLDLSKLEAGKLELDIFEYNIHALLEGCRIELAAKLAETQLSLEIEEKPQAILAHFDYGRIFQVVINILSNAIKYSPQGTAIQIRYSLQDDRSLLISIQDQGLGIADDEIDGVFDEFVQSKKIVTGTGMGSTGLGLAICKKIVEAHQGKIWVESELNKGTTFSFLIPSLQK